MQKMSSSDIEQAIINENEENAPISQSEDIIKSWDAPLLQVLMLKRDTAHAIKKQTNKDEFKTKENGVFRHFDEEKLNSFLKKTLYNYDEQDLEYFKSKHYSSQPSQDVSFNSDDLEYDLCDDLEFKYRERYKALEKLIDYSDDKDYLDALIDNWDKLKELNAHQIDDLFCMVIIKKPHPDDLGQTINHVTQSDFDEDETYQILSKIIKNVEEYNVSRAYDAIFYLYNPYHESDEDYDDYDEDDNGYDDYDEDDNGYDDEDDNNKEVLSEADNNYAQHASDIISVLQYVQSKNLNNQDDYMINKILNKIIQLNPEAIPDVIKFVQKYTDVVSNDILYTIITQRPDFVDGVYSICTERLDSLIGSDLLEKISKINPQYGDNIVNKYIPTIYDGINEFPNHHYSWQYGFLENTYNNLSMIKVNNPQKIFKAYEFCLNNESNKWSSLQKAYKGLQKLLNLYPEHKDDIFRLFDMALHSRHNQDYSYQTALDVLNETIIQDSSHIPTVLGILENCEKEDSHVYISWDYRPSLYENYGNITKEHPRYIPQILKLLQTGVSKSHEDEEKAAALNVLGYIIKNHPQYEKQVCDVFITLLETDNLSSHTAVIAEYIKNKNVSMTKILDDLLNNKEPYHIFKEILLANSDDLDRVYVAIKNRKDNGIRPHPRLTSSSTYLDDMTIYSLNLAISEMTDDKPERAKQFLQLINKGINEYKFVNDSTYLALHKIFSLDSSYSKEIVEILELCLQSNQNDSYSVKEACNVFNAIIEKQPEMTNNVVELIKIGLQSSKNVSPGDLYETLDKILELQPQLAGSVVDTLKIGLQSNKSNNQALQSAYKILSKIVKTNPELSSQILDTVTSCDNLPDKIYLYKDCMRHLPLEETVAKYLELEQDLRFAHKCRFTSESEFQYALDNFSKDKIVNSNLVKNQRRAMNILVKFDLLPQVLAKESIEKISSTEALEIIDFMFNPQNKLKTTDDKIEYLKSTNKFKSLDVIKEVLDNGYLNNDASNEIKQYMKDNSDWLIPASFNLASVFGEYFPSYIRQVMDHNLDYPKDSLSIHDAVYWLPKPMSDEKNLSFMHFIQRNMVYQNAPHQEAFRDVKELSIIAQSWDDLTAEEEKGRYQKVLDACKSKKYKGQHDNNFAIEAASFGVPKAQYHNYEDFYLAGLDVPVPFDTSVTFQDKSGKYVGRFLPRDDVRVGFFGHYTACCQHLGGIGHDCAVSTMKHPFSQLFVIERVEEKSDGKEEREIIAGSWIWENTEGKYRDVCFDNIEAIGNYSKKTLEDLNEKRDDYVSKIISCFDNEKYADDYSTWRQYFEVLKTYEAYLHESRNKEANPYEPRIEYREAEVKLSKFIENLSKSEDKDDEKKLAELLNKLIKTEKEYINCYKRINLINYMYEKAGEYLINEKNCRYVTIGVGNQDAMIVDYPSATSIALPSLYKGYTDAKSQVLLAENPNAVPLDKTKECPCYVRRVCFDDTKAMDYISGKIFPDGDQDLADVENRAGFVVEDPHRGVVGYVIYDEDDKYIADMAVLKEYRTRKLEGNENEPTSGGFPIDKSASNKLMFAIFKEIEKIGGKWSASMRDSTSFRLLKFKEKRGEIEIINKPYVERKMSDGSDVFRVEFKPIEPERQKELRRARENENADEEVKSQTRVFTKRDGR